MINGLGVLGWGVGGIEAEAAMLGQPVTMLIPQVIGFRLTGSLQPGATATDLVLTVTEMLRKKGVVDKFVEYLRRRPREPAARGSRHDRQHGAGIRQHLRHLPDRRRDAALPRALGPPGASRSRSSRPTPRRRACGATTAPSRRDYTDVLELDLATVEPSLAGPKRPQDRVPLSKAKTVYQTALKAMADERTSEESDRHRARRDPLDGQKLELRDGAVMIAAITSCTNTSNPYCAHRPPACSRAMRAERGLKAKPWVKTSLAPGSRVVTDYLTKAGLLAPTRVASASTWSATAAPPASATPARCKPEIPRASRPATSSPRSVLSGNRNFEGRVHPEVKMNFLASPPLVVAYALAGTHGRRPAERRARHRPRRQARVARPTSGLRDKEVAEAVRRHARLGHVPQELRQRVHGRRATGSRSRFRAGKIYAWEEKSTYVRNPPYFDGMTMTPRPVTDITGARCLALLGDSVTTDHISPAGDIAKTSPAAKYLVSQGVQPVDFNSYGARRGNHEVMMRGTFANIRLRNLLAPGTEGGVTRARARAASRCRIFDAAMRYKQEGTPLVILAGKEYGTGSSRDWAAKGTHAARRARRDRRELRAHPPLQPHRHGRAAAHVPGGQDRRHARPHRQRDSPWVRNSGHCEP